MSVLFSLSLSLFFVLFFYINHRVKLHDTKKEDFRNKK